MRTVPLPVNDNPLTSIQLERRADALGAVGIFGPLVLSLLLHALLRPGGVWPSILVSVAIGVAVHLATNTGKPRKAVTIVAIGSGLCAGAMLGPIPWPAATVALLGAFWIPVFSYYGTRAEKAAAARELEELREVEGMLEED